MTHIEKIASWFNKYPISYARIINKDGLPERIELTFKEEVYGETSGMLIGWRRIKPKIIINDPEDCNPWEETK